jgi:hypothetical protein
VVSSLVAPFGRQNSKEKKKKSTRLPPPHHEHRKPEGEKATTYRNRCSTCRACVACLVSRVLPPLPPLSPPSPMPAVARRGSYYSCGGGRDDFLLPLGQQGDIRSPCPPYLYTHRTHCSVVALRVHQPWRPGVGKPTPMKNPTPNQHEYGRPLRRPTPQPSAGNSITRRPWSRCTSPAIVDQSRQPLGEPGRESGTLHSNIGVV